MTSVMCRGVLQWSFRLGVHGESQSREDQWCAKEAESLQAIGQRVDRLQSTGFGRATHDRPQSLLARLDRSFRFGPSKPTRSLSEEVRLDAVTASSHEGSRLWGGLVWDRDAVKHLVSRATGRWLVSTTCAIPCPTSGRRNRKRFCLRNPKASLLPFADEPSDADPLAVIIHDVRLITVRYQKG